MTVNALPALLEYNAVMKLLPPRKSTAYKGDHGHVCVIGGGHSGYSGAVCLAGESALRAGAGLVSVVVAPESVPLLARGPVELMCYGLAHTAALAPLIEKSTTLVLGPGLSQNSWGKQFFEAAIACQLPKIVDADGLNWLAQNPQKQENWILTPHPGEAARLLGISPQAVEQDRIKAIKQLKQQYGGVIVLKGSDTLIIDEADNLFMQKGGFAILATGGTGDVLAGLIGGLVAQGASLSHAAQIGVCVHANAGRLEQTMGNRGMLASELLLPIRMLLNPEGPQKI